MIDQKTAPYGALLLRLSLGVLLLVHGLFKLLVLTLPGSASYFRALGLPEWFAYIVTFGEIIGGVLLFFGVYARFVALIFIPELLGTIILVHYANGWLFSNMGGGWEYPAFWAMALYIQFLLGDGKWALVKSPTF